jgi:hypothetical protein
MSQALDSLDGIWPSPQGSGATSSMTDPTVKLEGIEESPPEIARVADVLGPIEQVVLAADQKLGSIQQQVTTQTGEASADVERRVREAAVEQRQRVAQLRDDLTDRASELGARFEAIFNLLDEVDRDLAMRAGDGAAVRVTVTERQRVQIAHEESAAALPTQGAPLSQTAPPTQANPLTQTSKPRKEKGTRRWFRRSKRSSA